MNTGTNSRPAMRQSTLTMDNVVNRKITNHLPYIRNLVRENWAYAEKVAYEADWDKAIDLDQDRDKLIREIGYLDLPNDACTFVLDADRNTWFAHLVGVPVRIRKDNYFLLASLRYEIPEGPEYDEWYDYSGNQDIQRTWVIRNRHDLGGMLEDVLQMPNPEVLPWPVRQAVEPKVRPPRFAWLTSYEMNASKRPFIVHPNSLIDPDIDEPITLVEYTDLGG